MPCVPPESPLQAQFYSAQLFPVSHLTGTEKGLQNHRLHNTLKKNQTNNQTRNPCDNELSNSAISSVTCNI